MPHTFSFSKRHFVPFVLLGFSSLFAAPDFDRLDERIDYDIADPKIPGGLVRVVENDAIIYERAFGTLSADSTTPWDARTVVGIASISKSITATLVAVLVGEGHLDFNDPVSAYIPEFASLKLQDGSPSNRSPTIGECLAHTAGFPEGSLAELPPDSPIRHGDQAGAAHYFGQQGLAAQPGTRWTYSVKGYIVVSHIVEIVTGQSFNEVLHEKLLGPLGMRETTFFPDVSLARRTPRFVPLVAGLSESRANDVLKLRWAQRGTLLNVAGALFSTADDLQRFLQFHVDKGRVGDRKIVPDTVLAQLYQALPGASDYGIGFDIRSDAVIGHTGASGTLVQVDRATGRMLIVLTQAGSTNADFLLKGAAQYILPRPPPPSQPNN